MALPGDVSVFRGALMFFDKLGVYDVILPFLLVFTITYAILEKTKIFGMDKIDDKEYSRKNLNGMTAFVVSFFVIASTRLVAFISEFVAHVVLLLLLSVFFLLLVGSFHTGKKEFELDDKWKKFFTVLMFIGILLVFLNAMGWLQIILDSLFYRFDSIAVSSIFPLIVCLVFQSLKILKVKRLISWYVSSFVSKFLMIIFGFPMVKFCVNVNFCSS